MTSEIKALIILGIVVLSLLILLIIYLFFALRKGVVATKKIDYFVEDATYKLEKLNTTIDAINKLSAYAHIFELFLEQNSKTISEYISKDEENFKKLEKFIKSEIDNKSTSKKESDDANNNTKTSSTTSILENDDFDKNIEG